MRSLPHWKGRGWKSESRSENREENEKGRTPPVRVLVFLLATRFSILASPYLASGFAFALALGTSIVWAVPVSGMMTTFCPGLRSASFAG